MKVIKAGPKGHLYYLKLLWREAGVSGSEIHAIYHPRQLRGSNPTNRLLAMRKMFADAGYADEVAKVDQIFIDTYRGFGSKKAWEAAWKDYCENASDGGCDIPEDAL